MLNVQNIGRPIADVLLKENKNEKLATVSVDDKEEGKKKGQFVQFTNKIELSDDQYFQPIEDPNADRFVCYVQGAQGAGKSYNIYQFLLNWKKTPKNKNKTIYLFSLKDKDENLDKIKPLRIKIDEELNDLDWKDFEGQMVIFDDIDSISDIKIKKIVYSIVDNIINVGRSYKIDCFVTNHAPTDGKFTRTVLNSANMIVYFPNSGSKYGMDYLLKRYVGLSTQDIDNVKKLKSRAVYIYKNYPQIICTEKLIYLLGS